MRTTVILDELRIGQIKPDPAYDLYFRLLRLDLATLLTDPDATLVGRSCPGCGAADVPVSFDKEGLLFHDCPFCHTVFVSPVPAQAALDILIKSGRSARYRREMFAHKLAAQRVEHVHQSLIQWMLKTCDEHDVDAAIYCDVGSDDEAWIHAVEREAQFREKTFVSPLDLSRRNSNARYTTSLADAAGPFSVISCVSALDKVSDPLSLLEAMVQRLRPGGLLFFTTSSSSGLEYKLLGRDAPSFCALDRLTMFSVEALQDLLEKLGLDVVELSTPGRLDVEAIAAYLREHPAAKSIPFWGYLFERNDEKTLAELQLFLQRNLFSAYARVAARNPA